MSHPKIINQNQQKNNFLISTTNTVQQISQPAPKIFTTFSTVISESEQLTQLFRPNVRLRTNSRKNDEDLRQKQLHLQKIEQQKRHQKYVEEQRKHQEGYFLLKIKLILN